VASALPFQFTVEAATKPEPVTVRVNCGPPAVAVAGARRLIAGTGLVAPPTESASTFVPPVL
jgi:hypothetical protein